VAFDSDFVAQDAFAVHMPLRVPDVTLLSQLV